MSAVLEFTDISRAYRRGCREIARTGLIRNRRYPDFLGFLNGLTDKLRIVAAISAELRNEKQPPVIHSNREPSRPWIDKDTFKFSAFA